MKKLLLTCLVLLVILSALPVSAAPMKIYVGEVSAVGVPNRDEMQTTLQKLLASRLNGDGLVSVRSSAEADAVVTASYVVVDRTFSLDAVATVGGSSTLTRAFVQGENLNELIPAIGKLAEKLAVELAKVQPVLSVPPAAGVIMKTNKEIKKNSAIWRSQPLPGAMNLIATESAGSAGGRDIFLADNRRLFHFRQGNDLRLVGEKELKIYEKIIALHAIDAGNGALDLYLTVVRNEQLASQVWQAKGDSLQLVADGLPYFFRTMALPGAPIKLYAQKMGSKLTFFGDVFEAERNGSEIILKKPLMLPRFTSIFMFNQFADKNNTVFTVVISPENKLIVYDQEQSEVWRSIEKYGGSEMFMGTQSRDNIPKLEAPQIFMNQRIQVMSNGNVLVGKNDAFLFESKIKTYRNGFVYCLVWNGDSLEEKWHTRTAENYMPDFYYDDARKELLQLVLSQRPNIFSQGSTTLTITKVE
jgi:hypothetical protein